MTSEQITFGALLCGLIAWLSITDIRAMILPNSLNLLLAVGGLAQSLTLKQPSLTDAVLGAIISGGVLVLVASVYKKMRGIDGLGRGDQKFAAAAGLWVGWQGLPLLMCAASLLALGAVALRAGRARHLDLAAPLPFGPFLGMGTVAAWLTMTISF